MRLAVCGRRTVVKTELGIALVLFDALFKNILLLPEIENLFFAVNEIEICFNRFVHICLYCNHL